MVKLRSRNEAARVRDLSGRRGHRGWRLLAGSVAAVLAIVPSVLLAGPASAANVYGLENYDSLLVGKSMCMASFGGENNKPAILYRCVGSPDQEWEFKNVYPAKKYAGYTFMNLVNNNGDCLGTEGGGIAEETPIYAWECLGHPDQFWAVNGTARSCMPYGAIMNYSAYEEGATYVVGVSGGEGDIRDEAPLILYHLQYKCNNQMWNFIINS